MLTKEGKESKYFKCTQSTKWVCKLSEHKKVIPTFRNIIPKISK